MRQFDIYENPITATRAFAPYVAVLSSHHLPQLDEVVVAPLVNDSSAVVGDLELAVEINNERLVLVITDLSSLASQRLRRRMGSLRDREDEIRRALDRLFTGF